MLIDGDMHILENYEEAFRKCLTADEHKDYMYMYSIGDTHYFKHRQTRSYIHRRTFIDSSRIYAPGN
jgi:hypothetical protein